MKRMCTFLAVFATITLTACAELGGTLPELDFTAAKAPAVVTVAKEEPKAAVIVQRAWPKVCQPAAARIAKIHKVDGGKTPPEAVEAAFQENSRFLVRGASERTQCFCWAVNEGLVNIDPKDAEKKCKGVKLPKAEEAKKS